MKPGALEAILAAYLTDGHYNGIAIGVRNIDPMIFKHLADLGLIKTVFIVRGTGDTWGFGSYFPKKLSDTALECLEGPKKPNVKIRNEVLGKLDLTALLRWIVEFEGSIYLHTWRDRLILMVSMTQYETIDDSIINDSLGRRRLSVKDTEALIHEGVIHPSRLWLDNVIDKLTGLAFSKSFKHYKSYQLDLTTRKTSLVHNYCFYTDCTNDASVVNVLEGLAMPHTWKWMIVRILSEVVLAYVDDKIDLRDIFLIKRLIGCRIDNPLKGPYNEYVMARLPQIYHLLLNGEEARVTKRMRKLEKLIDYFTYERRKSLVRLLNTLTGEEIEGLKRLTTTIKSLEVLFDELLRRGTPIGRLWAVMYATH